MTTHATHLTDPLALDYHAGGPQNDDTNCTVCHSSLVEGYRTSYLVAAGFIAVTAVFVAVSAMRPAPG